MTKIDTTPPVITEPLSVDVVEDEVVLDGDARVDVSMTAEAAIETGVRLINAGIGIDDRGPPQLATPVRR